MGQSQFDAVPVLLATNPLLELPGFFRLKRNVPGLRAIIMARPGLVFFCGCKYYGSLVPLHDDLLGVQLRLLQLLLELLLLFRTFLVLDGPFIVGLLVFERFTVGVEHF